MHTHPWLTVIIFNGMAAFIPISALILYFKPAAWPYLLSLFSGLVIGFVDLGASEVQVPALLLLALAFFVGFASPGGPWRWGILTGIWVPVFEIVRLTVAPGRSPADSPWWGSLLALVFAFAGAYGGSVVRARGAGKSPQGTLP